MTEVTNLMVIKVASSDRLVRQVLEECERYKAALEFYASEASYIQREIGHETCSGVEWDRGAIAKEALEKKK